MRWGGIIVGLFIVWHILDLTTGTVHPGFQPGHPYANVVATSKSLPDSDIGFLERFLRSLDEAKRAGDASIVAWSALPRLAR